MKCIKNYNHDKNILGSNTNSLKHSIMLTVHI